MSLFHYGFISGTGKETEFQLRSNETERGHLILLDLDEVNSIIGPEYNTTDFRSASTIKFRSKDEKCGFTICGYRKDQMEMLCRRFTAYLSKIPGIEIEPVCTVRGAKFPSVSEIANYEDHPTLAFPNG